MQIETDLTCKIMFRDTAQIIKTEGDCVSMNVGFEILIFTYSERGANDW